MQRKGSSMFSIYDYSLSPTLLAPSYTRQVVHIEQSKYFQFIIEALSFLANNTWYEKTYLAKKNAEHRLNTLPNFFKA